MHNYKVNAAKKEANYLQINDMGAPRGESRHAVAVDLSAASLSKLTASPRQEQAMMRVNCVLQVA